MKRYFVFAYHQYYPNGGLDDLKASGETLEDVQETYKSCKERHYDYCYIYHLNDDGNFEIVDSEETDLYA